jgi:hypothetical protein
MFGFLTPRRSAMRTVAPALVGYEALEPRLCLSAATITSFAAATTGVGRNVTLSGYVVDESPSTVQLTFSGVVSGSTTPNSTGYFQYSGLASGVGTVQASGVDNESLQSNTMFAQVSSNAPMISGLTAVETGNGKMVTVSGTVMDESPGGRTVTLSGVVSGTATTNAAGQFSATLQATALGTVTATTTDVWGLSSPLAQTQLTSAAPTITGFTVTETANGKQVTVSGTVSDASPGGRTVTLGGVLSGTIVTQSNGQFSATMEASALGTATAVTSDVWGQNSPTAQTQLTSPAPMIAGLTVVESGPNRTVTVSGAVTDISPGGRTVTLSGVVSGAVVTNANGTFSVTLQASGLGTISAVTTDVWGQSSNTGQATVQSMTPTISSFSAVQEEADLWTFQGQVGDEFAYGLTVTFGGLLAGSSATVSETGWFYFSKYISEGAYDIATAQVTDWWGLQSALAQVLVDNRA